MLLEKVSGKSWEDLSLEILNSEMNIDFIFGWPNRNLKNQHFGHWVGKGNIVPVYLDVDYGLSLVEPAGDLSMNLRNYVKFILFKT